MKSHTRINPENMEGWLDSLLSNPDDRQFPTELTGRLFLDYTGNRLGWEANPNDMILSHFEDSLTPKDIQTAEKIAKHFDREAFFSYTITGKGGPFEQAFFGGIILKFVLDQALSWGMQKTFDWIFEKLRDPTLAEEAKELAADYARRSGNQNGYIEIQIPLNGKLTTIRFDFKALPITEPSTLLQIRDQALTQIENEITYTYTEHGKVSQYVGKPNINILA